MQILLQHMLVIFTNCSIVIYPYILILFCKILCITDYWSTCFLCKRGVHVNNFFHDVLFKLIGRLGRRLVPTLLGLCRLPIFRFSSWNRVRLYLDLCTFSTGKCGTKLFKCRNFLVLTEWFESFHEFNQSDIEFFVFIFDFSFYCFKNIIEHFWNLFCETVMTIIMVLFLIHRFWLSNSSFP